MEQVVLRIVMSKLNDIVKNMQEAYYKEGHEQL